MNKKVDKKWYFIGGLTVVILLVIAIIVSVVKDNKEPHTTDSESTQPTIYEQTIDFNDLLNPAAKNEQTTQESTMNEENTSQAASTAAETIYVTENRVENVNQQNKVPSSDVVDNFFDDILNLPNKGNTNTGATSGNTSTGTTSGSTSAGATSGSTSTGATSGNMSTGATSGSTSTGATSGNTSTGATSGSTSTGTTSGNTSSGATSGSTSSGATSGSTSSGIAGTVKPTVSENTTAHPDPDGPGWSPWVK